MPFERLEQAVIPLHLIAFDLLAGTEVRLSDGPLTDAVLAAAAIPGVLPPVRWRGRLLADGGMVNPVPVEPTRASDADLTVAVSLLGSRSPDVRESPAKETSEARPREEWSSEAIWAATWNGSA